MRRLLLPLAVLGVLALLAGLRLCRSPELAPRRNPPPSVELPPPPPPLPPPPAPVALAAGAPERPPERLLPFLERLGRARLLKDRRRLADLRGGLPTLWSSDLDWLAARLHGEIFAAAGAAELIRLFGVRRAIADLGEALVHPVHPFLKDIVIETLASLGGDAVVPLLSAIRSDADPGMRARCADALGRFEGPEAYHALATALRDPSPAVRSHASAALGQMKSQEAVRLLLESLRVEADPEVQADLAAGAFAAGGERWRAEIVNQMADRPGAVEVLRRRIDLRGDTRYARSYERSFFEPGGVPVPYDPSLRKIGFTVETGPGVTIQEVARAIFAEAPFDRYRAWFRLRRADEFPSRMAYDSYGEPAGETPFDALDGTVYIVFKDPNSFQGGVLGVTKGCVATVTSASLLHEVGHAFAGLGDEYADGSAQVAPNLAPDLPPPWQRLTDAGHLGAPPRRDDRFRMPTENCHLSNRATDTRYCPVCQLEIHARFAELTGAPAPW